MLIKIVLCTIARHFYRKSTKRLAVEIFRPKFLLTFLTQKKPSFCLQFSTNHFHVLFAPHVPATYLPNFCLIVHIKSRRIVLACPSNFLFNSLSNKSSFVSCSALCVTTILMRSLITHRNTE